MPLKFCTALSFCKPLTFCTVLTFCKTLSLRPFLNPTSTFLPSDRLIREHFLFSLHWWHFSGIIKRIFFVCLFLMKSSLRTAKKINCFTFHACLLSSKWSQEDLSGKAIQMAKRQYLISLVGKCIRIERSDWSFWILEYIGRKTIFKLFYLFRKW